MVVFASSLVVPQRQGKEKEKSEAHLLLEKRPQNERAGFRIGPAPAYFPLTGSDWQMEQPMATLPLMSPHPHPILGGASRLPLGASISQPQCDWAGSFS